MKTAARVRWLLVGLAALVICGLAASTGQSDRKGSARVVAPKTEVDEPTPLIFRPDIAPADAEAINAARPDYVGTIVSAKPFVVSRSTDRTEDTERATACLTQAVYYEAASETPEGQRAVAQVVLNRVRDPRFPPSVCGVVYQGSERGTGCQFTFTCDGALQRIPAPSAYERARLIAIAALSGRVEPNVGLATHYHTRQVVPYWRSDLVKLRTVGAHIFYGWQGRERSARGLRSAYLGIEPLIGSATVQTPAIVPETDPSANPFVLIPSPSPSRLASPVLPTQDFGSIRADDEAGELKTAPSGGLLADRPANQR